MSAEETAPPPRTDFIREIVEQDLASGKHATVVTRFPPEPNGYLHIGHAKSICLNFGLAQQFGGRCHLRFDDTNPLKEDVEYTEAIERDVRWLGFDWGPHLYHASDYFERLYEWAEQLVRDGRAYVCDLSEDEMRRHRGTLTAPGKDSPYRSRSVEENLDLLRRMRAGEFDEGSRVLRAKIDMASPNIVMRDPTLFRIRKASHHRTGDRWCIYPMYDYTHCLSDAIEGITHSICTLEFDNNRELYDWVLDRLPVPARPRQYEFARLNLTYTLMSKRKLLRLVKEGLVRGWDDPRMPTLAGIRRRGYTPEALRAFCARIGVSKRDSVVSLGLLEECVREDLNERTPRVMAVLRPLKLVIENYPEGETEEFEVPNFPDDPPRRGSRKVPVSREVYIERDDFMEDPPKKFFRLAPGREVRLRRAYYVTCTEAVKDAAGEVALVRCRYDPASRGGETADKRRVQGTLHWVSARHAADAEVRLYDRLFTVEDPEADPERDFVEHMNPESLVTLNGCKVEPALAAALAAARFQFERQGYFAVDPDARPGAPVFNRIVPLKDSWSKMVQKGTA